MKKILLILFNIFIVLSTYAQITLTQENIGDPGDIYLMAYDEEPPDHVSPGSAGPDQIWDFSELSVDYIDTVYYLHPDSTPYAGVFPGTNLAINQENGTLWGFTIKNLLELSIKGAVLPIPELGIIPVKLEPKDIMADFPVNYEDTLDHSFIADVRVESPEPFVDSIRYKSTTFKTSIVDAWGTMDLPMGNFPVLRVHETRTMVDSIWTKFIGTWIFVAEEISELDLYIWWSDDPVAGYYLVNIDVEPGTSNINSISFMHDPSVGIPESNNIIDFVAYPNPVGDQLNIDFDKQLSGSYKILDASGRIVINDAFSNQERIQVNTSVVPSGIYFFSIVDDQGSLIGSGKFLRRNL